MKYYIPIKFLPDNKIYKGHFPNNPITPGAYLLETIKNECNKILNKDVYFYCINECKFINPVIPSDCDIFTCTIEFNEISNNEWKINSTIQMNENIKLKLKAIIKTLDA